MQEVCRAFFLSNKKMRNCNRQQEKRRGATHWIEQCQGKCMIHWIGKCQSRSPDYTGSETLSEGAHSHCMLEPSPVSSASFPPPAGSRTATTTVVSAFLSFSLCLTRSQMRPSPGCPGSPLLPPSTDASSVTSPLNVAFGHSICFPCP